MEKITDEQKVFMENLVKELVLITLKKLDKFTNMFPDATHGTFVNNIIKNYVGNMVYLGCDDIKTFNELAQELLENIVEFFQHAQKQYDKKHTTGTH